MYPQNNIFFKSQFNNILEYITKTRSSIHYPDNYICTRNVSNSLAY